ncbi:MAG: hypothetical protein ACRERC_21130 [Candidatus Binatia bacterium]
MLRERFERSIQAAVAAALSMLLLLPAGAGAQMPTTAPAKPPAPMPSTIEGFGSVAAKPFTEATRVVGSVTADLSGVWLLLAYTEIGSGKAKTFPQLLKITKGADGPEINLVDVRWPPAMKESLRQANNRTLEAWAPSAEERATLAKSWATLPKQEQKFLDDFHFAKIDYTLIAPDRYGDTLKSDELLNKVLADSKFALKIEEQYYPRDLGELNSRVSQLASRTTIYAFKSSTDTEWKGEQVLGFVAAGAGTPLPLNFSGPFVMQRLAKP